MWVSIPSWIQGFFAKTGQLSLHAALSGSLRRVTHSCSLTGASMSTNLTFKQNHGKQVKKEKKGPITPKIIFCRRVRSKKGDCYGLNMHNKYKYLGQNLQNQLAN